MSDVTMAGLPHGTRVHHTAWDWNGTIRIDGDSAEIVWDGSMVASGISDNGPIFPGEFEIIAAVFEHGTEVRAADCLGGAAGIISNIRHFLASIARGFPNIFESL